MPRLEWKSMTKTFGFLVWLSVGAAVAQIEVNGSRTFAGNLRVKYPNATTTGTTVNRLAKLTGAPATAVLSAAGDTGDAVGIVVAGAGASGAAESAFAGKASGGFDG